MTSTVASLFLSPATSEQAFYRAFQDRDANAMMCVWDDTDDIVCVHPLGDVLIGRAAIAHSWAEIFASGGRSKIHTRMHRQFIHDDIAVHIVYEIFEIPGEPALQRPIIATNSYRHSLETGWRLILHHASPSPRPLTVVRRAASGSVH